ncbi:MAG: hypothetical protein J2P59_12610, partial [Acidimicrobiales bacterium]|nr:hypothetical protein [Acidimicrobiales bacterium]
MAIEVRPFAGTEDVAAVQALLRSAAAGDDHEPFGDHEWLESAPGDVHGITSFLARDASGSAPV